MDKYEEENKECLNEPLKDETPCDDYDPCTKNDKCKDGKCAGEGECQCEKTKDCSKFEDDNLCNGTLICKDKICVVDEKTIVICDTSKDTECEKNICKKENGKCEVTKLEDGKECNDGLKCTENDKCNDGVCKGEEKNCNDDNPCTDDLCNKNGECENNILKPCCGNKILEEKEECDDGNFIDDDGCSNKCIFNEIKFKGYGYPSISYSPKNDNYLITWVDKGNIYGKIFDANLNSPTQNIKYSNYSGEKMIYFNDSFPLENGDFIVVWVGETEIKNLSIFLLIVDGEGGKKSNVLPIKLNKNYLLQFFAPIFSGNFLNFIEISDSFFIFWIEAEKIQDEKWTKIKVYENFAKIKLENDVLVFYIEPKLFKENVFSSSFIKKDNKIFLVWNEKDGYSYFSEFSPDGFLIEEKKLCDFCYWDTSVGSISILPAKEFFYILLNFPLTPLYLNKISYNGEILEVGKEIEPPFQYSLIKFDSLKIKDDLFFLLEFLTPQSAETFEEVIPVGIWVNEKFEEIKEPKKLKEEPTNLFVVEEINNEIVVYFEKCEKIDIAKHKNAGVVMVSTEFDENENNQEISIKFIKQ